MKILTSRYVQIGLALFIAVLVLTGISGSAAAAGPVYHTVQYGQTLYSIANNYGTSPWAIACANGLYNPNYVYAGQVLVIPSGYNGGGCQAAQQYHPQDGCGCQDNHADYAPPPQNGCGCDGNQGYHPPHQDGCGCDGQQGWAPPPPPQGGCGCNDGHASYHPSPNLGCYYTVQWGENLFRIALRYGISWVVLAQGNGLYNGNYVYAGQVLRVPCAY